MNHQVSISSTFYAQLLHQYFGAKNFQSQNGTRKKLHKALLDKKFACKTLMKWITDNLRAKIESYL
jgi:hypothetical protein